MDDDWDLQAVVRRCFVAAAATTTSGTPASATTTASVPQPQPDLFALLSRSLLLEEENCDHLMDFPDLLATETAMQELEQLCKPFSPQIKQTQHLALPTTMSIPAPAVQPLSQPQRPSHSQISRSKRRKNQQKRVVCQVPAEGLSSDMWAWRKYGQKPIKGSPYPRGYYRCSSSKGCLARKQVERSRTDPSMFVITYTADHNHPLPTHRNSLAGCTRNKCAPPDQQETTTDGERSVVIMTTSKDDDCAVPAVFSPTTPLTASMEEKLLQTRPDKRENQREDVEEEKKEQLIRGDDETMFMDLEELGENTSAGPTLEDCFSDNLAVALPTSCSFTKPAATAASAG